MQESEIIEVIRQKVGSTDCNIWTIGITDDPERRKADLDRQDENTKHWKDWKADTETIARNVEKHFLDKGMNVGTGGADATIAPTFVYVF